MSFRFSCNHFVFYNDFYIHYPLQTRSDCETESFARILTRYCQLWVTSLIRYWTYSYFYSSMAPKPSAGKEKLLGDDDEVLQAVILADSFNKRFRPLTTRKPRVNALYLMVKFPLRRRRFVVPPTDLQCTSFGLDF